MPCSKEEALVRLFYNASSSFQLLLLFLFSSAIFLFKFLNFIGSYSIFQRDQHYDYVFSEYDEEEEEEIQESYSYVDSIERDHIVADIIGGGETLVFLHKNDPQRTHSSSEEFISLIEDTEENYASETLSVHKSPLVSDFENEVAEEAEVEFPTQDADSVPNSVPVESRPTSPITLNIHKSDLVDSDKICDEDHVDIGIIKNKKVHETNLTRDERFFVYAPTHLEAKKLIIEEKNDEEIYGDSCTVGSTSKSSSEWRSSIKDSGTEDPFSSSSRRSCPKWESYTVFQKYDEEMSFLDRISAQKLQETESLRSIKVSPRSISERIVYKFSTMNKRPGDIHHNPYNELEAAYVAQICITWEALNWNYKNFQSKRASRHDLDVGCPATIAQKFQQFQVLLQRYVENEPYEHGRRPEIYARMRHLAPKLLLVPEYRESDDDQRDDGFHSKISSSSFLKIMEDGIRTFMSFLKADKEKTCQALAAYFRRNQRGLVDPTLLRLIKKVNQKKKVKVKDLRRSSKLCLRKRKLTMDKEMEILMALIDLKVVSRVLRMRDLSEEQLHWCEEKMSKVRVMDRKLERDSTPLFFPAH
ncbi:uncharacterized protein LOC133316996 [Gastrolobium bilobum]|uniref:uncharacterized protein LOC133316996 n=1 Tax=Gastrolobium bilobum TaxID=150636 RepID=UPI002AAF1D4E|nr:uncharacterized protein LOC133316996 [Gastrolobium bilobum]